MPYKFKSLFSLPLIILALDNIASAIVMPVLMKLLYPCGIDGYCQIVSISDNVIIFSALVYLLSPSYLFASPIVGQLADVYGRKKTLIGCLFMSVAGYVVSFAANSQHNVFLILLAILLLNASSSSMQVVQAIAADVSEDRKKSHHFSLIAFVMMPLYFTFASTIEHYLKSISSLNNIIILCALVITLINLIALHYYPRETHGENYQVNELTFAESVNNFSVNIWKLLALFAAFEFGSSLYFESIMNYLAENHYYLVDSSTLLIYRMLAMTLGTLLVYPVLRKYFSNTLIIVISISVCCVGMLGSLLTNTLFFQVFYLLIFTMGEIIFLPTIWSLLSDETLAKHQGLVMGIKGAIWSLAWSLGLLAANKIELLFSSIYPIVLAITITATCLMATKHFLKILKK